MRKIYLLFAFIALNIAFSSCSKSDDNSSNKTEQPVINGNIVGTWGIVSEKYKNEEVKLSDCELKYGKMIFYSNGTANEEYGYQENGKCILDSWDHNYKFSDKTVIMKSVGNASTELRFYVKELTDTKLVLEQFYIEESPYPGEYIDEAQRTISTYKKLK